ncbi:hypothetical protein FJTKL_11601 [Diaporthe vaccinii]|uniref:Small ribosomal subunit protein eS1 n=1 Tax=Diaporthe vaccinii TaxID=105482 RepID=A0ABR4EG82_9PEZI
MRRATWVHGSVGFPVGLLSLLAPNAAAPAPPASSSENSLCRFDACLRLELRISRSLNSTHLTNHCPSLRPEPRKDGCWQVRRLFRSQRRCSTAQTERRASENEQSADGYTFNRNKRLSKGKKGLKKKTVDPFSRKDWYGIKAPAPFNVRDVGKTLVNRTTGLKNANDSLKGRIVEVSLADLQKDEDHAFRKIKLRIDEVQGKNCLTNFHGLDFTSDKLRSLVRKWQSLIEANVTVKTTDDYLLRLFAIAFTKRRPNQIKKTTYAASSQIRAIRRKMTEIITREAGSCTLQQLTNKLIPEVIGREIEKATQGIYPLQNVHIRKVKLLKQPKFDLGTLLALHGESSTDEQGQKVEREFKERVLEEV